MPPRALVVAPGTTVRLVKCPVEHGALVGAHVALADEEIEQSEQRGDSLCKWVFLVGEQQ
jgi:hypothetical protein